MIFKTTSQILLAFAATVFFTVSVSGQTTRYVKPVSSGTGNGSSWDNASNDLQAMINISVSGDQVWVAAGTYKPNRKSYDLTVITPADIDNSFVLEEGVAIYGSFAGTETTLSQRTLPEFGAGVIYSTVLSGDFNNNDVITSEGEFITVTNNEENATHLIMGIGSETNPLTALTILDGFTITGAYADIRMYAAATVNGTTAFNDTGAGIHNSNSSATYSNIAINANVATSGGGGIYNKNSGSTFTNIAIYGNTAMTTGGGISNIDSSITITGGIINGNKAIYNTGGGILNTTSFGSENTETTLANVIISNNSSSSSGGGIQNINASIILNDVSITGNTAQHYGYPQQFSSSYGGGIFNSTGSLSMTNVTIENNIANGNDGGGIANFNGSFITMDNVTINNNTSMYGNGGGLANVNSSATGNDVTISSNNCDGGGGGIYNYTNSSSDFFNAALDLTNATLTGNTSSGIGGAAIYNAGSNANLTDSLITENEGYGSGGISNSYGTTGTYTNVTFSNNTGSGNGGALTNSNCSPIFNNVTFDGNTGLNGGAISNNDSSPVFTNVIITNNTVTGQGGAIRNIGGAPVFNNVTINSNSAASKGGAVFNDHSNSIFTNAEIKGNTAGSGGGIYNVLCAPIFTNVAITGNKASFSGGGIYNEGASVLFTNVTIAANNGTSNNGGGIFSTNGGIYNTPSYANSHLIFRNSVVTGNNNTNIFTAPNSTVICNNSLITGITINDANGNINGDTNPLFIDALSFSSAPSAGGNYGLQSTSPIINQGSNLYFSEGQLPDLSAITTDAAGNLRIQGDTVDIGAYEYAYCTAVTPELSAIELCTGATIADLSEFGTGLLWYENEDDNTPLTPETIITSGEYFVSQLAENCESERAQLAITINITAPPSGNAVQEIQITNDNPVYLNMLEVTGANIQWYASENDIADEITLPAATELINNTTYYATQTENGCESAPLAITVSFVLANADFTIHGLRYYPNPVSEDLNIESKSLIQNVMVYNLLGEKVFETNFNADTCKISLASLHAGSYIVYVVSEGKSSEFLIIKK